MRMLCRCTPKQIDLQAILLLQLPYYVSVLLLTSRCNWQLHNTNAIIVWRLHKVLLFNKTNLD